MICFKKLILFLFVILISCGGSSSDETTNSNLAIVGTWKGVVQYDESSCGSSFPEELLPDLRGTEYQVEIFESSDRNSLCDLRAIDQTGRTYTAIIDEDVQQCDFDTYLFPSDEDASNSDGIVNEPASLVFTNVSESTADLSIAFFFNRFSVCRFTSIVIREN